MASLPIDRFKRAVLSSDAAELSRVLRDYPELRSQIDAPIFSFDTPAIVQAAGAGHRQVIEVLLDAGAGVNARSQWWAGSFGVLDTASPDLATFLIERGATVDVHAAARLGMLEKLRELISAQPDLVHARGGDGKTPLHFAATVEIADYLLSQGAQIDASDIDHESTAAQHLVKSNPDVVRFLVERGCRTDLLLAAAIGDPVLAATHLDADPNSIRLRVSEQFFPKRNPQAGGSIYIWTLGMNRSPHQVARKFGHADVLELLMERSALEVKLVNAFAVGDEVSVRALLADRPDLVQTLSAEDRLQIVYAAQDNDTAAVRLMLEYGWPIDGPLTPLHWAAFHGNAEMTQAILKHNPPLEQKDATYQGTPLGWAIHGSQHGWFCATGDYAAVVEALLGAGAIPPPGAEGSAAVKELLADHHD